MLQLCSSAALIIEGLSSPLAHDVFYSIAPLAVDSSDSIPQQLWVCVEFVMQDSLVC